MEEKPYTAKPANRGQPREPEVRSSIMLAAVGAGLVFTAVAAVVFSWLGHPSGSESLPEPSTPTAPASEAAPAAETDSNAELAPSPTVMSEPALSPRIPRATAPTPSADPRLLVKDIWLPDSAAGPLTPQRATQWKNSLAQLVQSGAASVPAIAEVLGTNQNQYFAAQDSAALGYSSVRAAMFDALEKIGGSEARDLLARTLRQTGDPAEIQLLAAHLEQMAPGEHRADILAAARQTLDQVRKGQLPGGDMGPVFDVLRKYGDSSIIADLQASRSQWSHYASIALAGLPDGAGIPSLLEIAQTTSKQKPPDYLVSFQLLAQAAAGQSSAAAGLLELVRANKVPAAAWPQIAQGLLAANAYQYGQPSVRNLSGYATAKVNGGQQQFYTPPLLAGRDADLIQARVGFIDTVLAITSDPTASNALTQARAKLVGKTGHP